MLQQTFEALETSFNEDNDACIDCAKSIIEVICKIIVEELDDPSATQKPSEENPKFGRWFTAAVRVMRLGEVRDPPFQRLVSHHHTLTTHLGTLRNKAGVASHGKQGFIDRLSAYHRRAAVLSADAIVAYLHEAYKDVGPNPNGSREPHERFAKLNDLIDAYCAFEEAHVDLDDGYLRASILLHGRGEDEERLYVEFTPSQALFASDRPAYVEAYQASKSAAETEQTESLIADEEE